MTQSFELLSYEYHLPEALIAQSSVQPHHNARLMVVDRETGDICDETTYFDLDRLIPPDRVLFFNNSRVLRARVSFSSVDFFHKNEIHAQRADGEIFFLKLVDNDRFEALVRPGKRFKLGTRFILFGRTFSVISMTDEGRILELEGGGVLDFFESYGSLPLPPYIEYSREKEKDYQTEFAEKPGSVAAPTASLHFTEALLDKLPHQSYMVTLHVGLGTFQGIQTEDIRDFAIHEESVEIDKAIFHIIANIRINNKKVLAVGTTVCRTLESLPYLWKILDPVLQETFSPEVRAFWDAIAPEHPLYVDSYTETADTMLFSTKIYIFQGFQLRIVEDLITNFHLPKSSLLVLVATFLSREKVLALYQYAIDKRYRFFSFGDGMYIRGK